jgi:RimJ/RimL family protein N-acetyltransferase
MEDAEAIFASYAQDSEVTRFLTWRPHQRIEETRAFVQSKIEAWNEGFEFTWAILINDVGLIGGIALRQGGFKVDFGYVIARAYWGKGFAAEALRPLVDWAMRQPEIFRVWAVCDTENPASARVMEKVGMTREGVLKKWVLHPQAGDTPRDCLCYSITKELYGQPATPPYSEPAARSPQE